jgi:hypothetical protein
LSSFLRVLYEQYKYIDVHAQSCLETYIDKMAGGDWGTAVKVMTMVKKQTN